MDVHVYTQGSNLDSVPDEDFNISVDGQVCSELSVQGTQVYNVMYMDNCLFSKINTGAKNMNLALCVNCTGPELPQNCSKSHVYILC